ncbi:DUF480 domain-containing protein [Sinimarinibacterium sp. CAU 1509]|uniref:YceH family protein n=1 Tax=Sinimarinibacterium sp. CAU 1509 TaxID=2562283 RepID=UPI0010AC31FA|nr:DUF480 domain-containing protein [Sinimarinibacterium sp. CAU 1509]TJY58312.1 DUF480 domain-containing protein [Sinimarinibacterium sp. CAU 1509]
MSELILSPDQARVVAVLVEKSITTPQYYPMTVNGIMMASNQKTARSPVMNLTEGQVGSALNSLEELKLVTRDSFSARAQKWRQQFMYQMMLKPPTQALLVTLMLRGPQTAAELRSNASSLGGPSDAAAFSAAMNDLADRAQPLVVLLPRAPGQSAARYTHTLCGVSESAPFEVSISDAPAARGADPQLAERLAALEARVSELERQLGLGPATSPTDDSDA